MLKIGWVIGNLEVHGSTRRVVEMSNALVARGHWVTIYTGADDTACSWLPCAARVLPMAQMQDESHDALIFAGAGQGAYGLIERSRCAVRILYVLALDERNLDALLVAGGHRFLDIARSPAWTIMANSTWQWEWLRANLRPDAELLIGGVNRTIFHPEGVKRDPARKIILTSGRRRAREGSGTVAEAIEIVRQTVPEAAYAAYAYGNYPQDEMRRTYCEAEAFADGQWYAGWNNPVVEAMACKCPVVCTDIGGVRDFAVNEETALLVPVGDAQSMAQAILRLLGDVELRLELICNAYERVGALSYAAAAERLERIIKERRNVSLSG